MNNKVVIKCVLFFNILFCSVMFASLPENYDSLSAEQKRDILWEKITTSHEQDQLPTADSSGWRAIVSKLKSLFSLNTTFDHVSDELPSGRVKFIHATGAVAKILFLPVGDHPFTGIYKTGGTGLARLSLAAGATETNYTPGIAVKFLIDGQPSRNIVAMYSLEGQGGNWNFFANNFTSKITKARSFFLKIIECMFEWTRKPANDLPVWHLATIDSTGKDVPNPVVPEQLILKPTTQVQQIISPDSREDFRLSLSTIQSGELYYVYGMLDKREIYIGMLLLDSELLASNYGDKHLFFQHQR